jgi:formylglycine-generating enzyme required for sulfatase activity
MSVLEIEWVKVPAGKFSFGLNKVLANDLINRLPEKLAVTGRKRVLEDDLSREMPEQVIFLEEFYISRYPITNAQYLRFAQSDHRYSHVNVFSDSHRDLVLRDLQHQAKAHPNHPCVDHWHFAQAFCDWLDARLPTSMEWEKAARGDDGRLYPWGNDWSRDNGNFSLNPRAKAPITTSVKSFPSGKSPYGVMDMLGNTYEWTISTMCGVYAQAPRFATELIVCRGCDCSFDPQVDDSENPDWFRNRVTNILLSNPNFSGPEALIGFRPILDRWRKRLWPGQGNSQESD